MKKFLFALIVLIRTTAYGGESPTEDIRLHIKVLSSEKFAGRLSGSVGGLEAGDYIANELKNRGLLPPVADSYFQPFEISLKSLGKDNRLVISGKELKVLEDYVPLTVCNPPYSPFIKGGDSFSPPLEKGGKGGFDRGFSSEDVIGKVAVVRYDEAVPDGGLPAEIKAAEEAGAKALLILKQDLYSDYTVWKELIPPKLRTRWEKSLKEDFAHFLQMKVTQKMNLTPPVTSKIPCLLVREDRLIKEIEISLPFKGREREGMGFSGNTHPHLNPLPEGEEIGTEGFSDEIRIKVDITEDKITARNIIGYLPGKGEHKDEVVIIGAHYDHLGLDSKGHPFPGADDNASGVAALLKVAKRLSEKGPLRRSVVFIAFDGEEWGLTGSRYYTEHAVFPLNKTVLMVNMDAIGRNEPDAIHFLGSQRSLDVRRLAGEMVERNGMKLLDDIEFAFKYGSDHYSFYEKGIPAIDLTSSYHEDFHKITDTWEKVNVDKVSRIADLVYRLTLEVSNSAVNFQKPLQVDVPFPEQR
ncbi:MAG: M28 family peptidase [Nitrospirae bacterium]|nr:M28 family peptidase [Nitrospirota bacterium]